MKVPLVIAGVVIILLSAGAIMLKQTDPASFDSFVCFSDYLCNLDFALWLALFGGAALIGILLMAGGMMAKDLKPVEK